MTLPRPPADLDACFRVAFPDVPPRDLTAADVVRIIGRAKVLDRTKSACGLRAQAWIDAVERTFAK